MVEVRVPLLHTIGWTLLSVVTVSPTVMLSPYTENSHIAAGSSRIPALQTGIFGFRPSTHSISTEGLVKVWPEVDTPAWFARDLQIFPDVLEALQPAEPSFQYSEKPPLEILYPCDFMPDDSPEQVQAMEDFLNDVAEAMGCTWRKVCIEKDWAISAPVEEKELKQFLFNVSDKRLCLSLS